jgi:hypothetical protein
MLMTRLTVSPKAIHFEVVSDQRMTALTVCLACSLSTQVVTAKCINFVGHWLQVGGINTVVNHAEVIQGQSLRNRPDQKLIDDTMRHVAPTIHCCLCIAPIGESA